MPSASRDKPPSRKTIPTPPKWLRPPSSAPRAGFGWKDQKHLPVHTAPAVTRHAGLNLYASRPEIVAGVDIERPQPLLRHPIPSDCRYEIDHSRLAIDVRSPRDSDFAAQCSPSPKTVRHRHNAIGRIDIMPLPQRTTSWVVRIDRVDADMLGGQNDHVARPDRSHVQFGNIKRLAHHKSVSLKTPQPAK